MKSNLTRVLVDEDKCYRFSSVSLNSAINKKIKAAGTTKQLIQEMIGEKAHVSPEAVRNWCKGANGPGSIENVKACADVLGIHYTDLLIEILNEEKINNNEALLVEKIYQMLVAITYDFQKVSYRVKQNLPDKPKDINTDEDLLSYASQKIIDCFQLVDQSSLRTSLPLRDKLHKILFQVRLLFSGNWSLIPEEWIEILENLNEDPIPISANGISRPQFFFDAIDGKTGNIVRNTLPEIPLCYESAYAERVGLSNYILSMEVDEDSDENDENNPYNEDKFLATHGVSRNYPVDPGTLYIDGIVRAFAEIFKLEFPTLFKEDMLHD